MFFHFDQNNSFGVFHGPAENVIVEADDAEEANRIVVDHEVYFDGVRNGEDCGCCGDRWSRLWEEEKGDEVPSIYGESDLSKYDHIIIYKDGNVTGSRKEPHD